MKKIKLDLKLLTANIIVFAIILFGYSFLLGTLFHKDKILSSQLVYDVWLYKSNLIPLAYAHFIFVHLISVIYFGIEKINLYDEVLQNVTKRRICNGRLLILLAANGLVFIIMTVFTLCFYFQGSNHTALNFSRNGVVVSFICYHFASFFLPGVIAILFGFITSKIKRIFLEIIVFIIIQFFFGYPMLWVEQNLYPRDLNHPVLNFLLDFSAILPGEIDVSTDFYSINPVQTRRWILLFFWCFLLFTIYYFIIDCDSFYKITFRAIVPIIVSILLFLMCIVPYSSISGNYRAHSRYDGLNEDLYSQAGRRNEPARFSVIKYNIDIYAFLNLKFKVRMQLDECGLEEYKFTLLDSFKIYKIKDQNGNNLEYKREDYYLSVYPVEGTSEIEILYGGAGEPFYGEAAGICLKGGTPFFPIPGFVPVYADYADSNFHNIHFFNLIGMERVTEFYVKVHTLGKVFSSLPSEGYNEFHGNADSFFLLKGFYERMEYEGVTIIYPPFCIITQSIYDEDILKESIGKIKEKTGEEKFQQVKDCIFIDWPFPGSRPIDVYSNYISIVNIDPRILDIFDEYLELEEL